MLFKRYIIRGSIGLALVLLATSAVNWVVDPYGIYGTDLAPALNADKPFAGSRSYTTKHYQAVRARPRGLIVGNSRPELGLDPAHACWPASAQAVYNISLRGQSVYNQVRYAQHAIEAGQVTSLVMALDFKDFLISPDVESDPHEWPVKALETRAFLADAFGKPQGGFALGQVKDYATAALSINTLIDSLVTLSLQESGSSSQRPADGFNDADRYYLPIVRNEGTRVLFEQTNRSLVNSLAAEGLSLHHAATQWSTEFETLKRLLAQTSEKGIQVKLLINPYHAEYLTSIEIAGVWPLFEAWKRRLVEIVSEAGDVPLWDFSVFGRFSIEPIAPLAKKGESLDWFWEPAHYRKELGDIMLSNLWRSECKTPPTTETFGTLLDPDHITDHLATQRAAKNQYLGSNPDVIRRIKQLIQP